jgi:hypothetical protein
MAVMRFSATKNFQCALTTLFVISNRLRISHMNGVTLNGLVQSILRSQITPSIRFEELVSADLLLDLCDSVYSFLSAEPVLLRLSAPIVIVGDIHGNIPDLLRIFEECGYPPHQKYLFLGDYIDRGLHSIEVITLLFALKCKFPEHIYLLRGNHETFNISSVYGFSKECKKRFSDVVFTEFNSVFECLPIAAVVGRALFCVHGGISPALKSAGSADRNHC